MQTEIENAWRRRSAGRCAAERLSLRAVLSARKNFPPAPVQACCLRSCLSMMSKVSFLPFTALFLFTVGACVPEEESSSPGLEDKSGNASLHAECIKDENLVVDCNSSSKTKLFACKDGTAVFVRENKPLPLMPKVLCPEVKDKKPGARETARYAFLGSEYPDGVDVRLRIFHSPADAAQSAHTQLEVYADKQEASHTYDGRCDGDLKQDNLNALVKDLNQASESQKYTCNANNPF